MRHGAVWLIVSTICIPLASPLEAREGFGFSKKAVQLDRRVAPEILLVGDRLSVKVEDDRGHSMEAKKLRSLVEETMTEYDTRLTGVEDDAHIVVHLRVRDVMVDESWSQKREYESRRTGTKVEYDSKGNKKEKPVYTSVPIDVNYKDVRGLVDAQYRVIDTHSGTELYSGKAKAEWSQSYKQGDGAPMMSELETLLIDRVAKQISRSLVGAREPVRVLVPRGSFDRLVAVAEQGRWTEYLQQVESHGALKKPAAEAYRQYALGVAKEALAYESPDEQTTLDLLESAASHYRQAVAMNPRETLFARAYENTWTGGEATSPIERVDSGVANYRKLHEHRQQLAAAER